MHQPEPPLDDASVLIASLERGETLPARWYTDPAITELEQKRIFAKGWAYIGPSDALTHVGDYITGTIGGWIPVVVLRNETGLLGLVNICRHRRHELVQGCGNVRALQCRYHGWTYNLQGCLAAAPRSATEPDFHLEDYPLLTVRVETLGPWVFVNAADDAIPLHDCFGGLLSIIAEAGIDLGSMVRSGREEWDARANWKTMLENYLECYHCAIAHPGFSAAIDVRPQTYRLTSYGWFLSQVGQVRQSALTGRGKSAGYDASGDISQAQYHLLFPNTTININPGFPNLSIDVWWPNGPNATRGFSEQYFAPGVSETFAQQLMAFNRQVSAEDDALTDSVQRGLRAGVIDKGRYLLRAEHLVGNFQKLVVQMVTGETITPQPGESTLLRQEPDDADP